MLNAEAFRALVSGERRGLAATLARAGLQALEWPYSAAVRWRNYRFDSGRQAAHRVAVPVISVGNLTLGGTGKTPFVEWLARWFRQHDVRVALVSRGYKARAARANDEALELAARLPDVPHVQDANRVRAAKKAIAEFGAQLIILDDGFQHRRLARDLDIVLVDALEPFGFEHVFPRGTLREPLEGWQRANAIVLTRSDLVDDSRRAAIHQRARAIAPRATWAEAAHVPYALVSIDGQERPLDALAGQAVAAFCGIGNPAAFRQSLARCGYRTVAMRALSDHFAYPAAEIQALARWSDEQQVAAVLCTCKDLVKLAEWPGERPLWALAARMQFVAGESQLAELLQPLLAGAIPPN